MATAPSAPVHLGAVPAIQTRRDVDLALYCLSWLASQRMHIHAARDRKISAETAAAEVRLRVVLDDGPLRLAGTSDAESVATVSTYETALKAEVERWVAENPAEFGDERTLKFSHGTIGLRRNPASIGFVGDKKDLVSRITKTLAVPLAALLKKLGLSSYWRLSAEPDLRGIKKAFDEGQLKRADLRKHGFVYCEGAERVEITLGVTPADESGVQHESAVQA